MTCPRWYYWRAVCNITTDGVSAPLVNGSAYHSAWAAYEEAILKGEDHRQAMAAGLLALNNSDIHLIKNDEYRNLTTAIDTLTFYWEQWKHDYYKTIDVEVGFAVDIGDVVFIGKIDRVCDSPLGKVIMEHKTTSIIGDRWNERGRPNLQIDGYYSAYSILTNSKLYGGVLDVCPVPAHKLLKKGTKTQPPFRIITARNDKDIDCWIANVNEWWKTLLHYRNDNIWPMNTERCVPLTGYKCNYTTLCSQFPHPHKVPAEFTVPSEYKVEKWAPFELNLVEAI